MINQTAWLRTRRKLLSAVKTQVRLRLGTPSRALETYAAAITKDYRATWRPVAPRDLKTEFTDARVVLAADFHAYAQSQRAHVRVLRDVVNHAPVTLALECLGAEHDAAIARYLAGRITEQRFLKLTNWERDWGFPFANYRPLFDLARDRGFAVVGLSSRGDGGLAARDRRMAKRIGELVDRTPDGLVFAVVGEWHLARPHLPARVRARLKVGVKVLTILQDIEPLYFRLAARDGPAAEWLRAPGDRLCHMVSPPWMKWQSYLMYLERAYDRDLPDDPDVDYSDHVASLIEVLESDLKIKTKRARVQVFCPNSRLSLARQRLSLPKRHARALLYHLERDLSFYFPERDWLYLSRATINHASGLAGQFVHAHLSGRTRAPWDMPRDFIKLIWIEAVGFFLSKSINPRRKAETLAGVRVELAARHPRDRGRRALLLALDQRLSEVVWTQTGRTRPLGTRGAPPEAYFEAARIVGYMLGERVFQKVRGGVISLPRLMSYLKMNVEGEEFTRVYWRLIAELEGTREL